MAHHHDHHHHTGNIKIAFFLNLFFTILELIGGVYVNSVAILSDALHDLGDSLALGFAWYADHKAKQRADEKFTFGYQRFSLLGALVNGIILIVGSGFVIKEAIDRIIQPEASDPQGMFIFAIIGVLVNGYAAYKVSHGTSLNERMVSWHLLEDVLGWVAVLIVSVVLMFKQIPWLDPLLSLFISGFILWNVIKRLRETLTIFLQGSPQSFRLEDLIQDILEVRHVVSTHHSHLWSLDGAHHVFTTHIILDEVHELQEILLIKSQIRDKLKNYDLTHHTIEVELSGEPCAME